MLRRVEPQRDEESHDVRSQRSRFADQTEDLLVHDGKRGCVSLGVQCLAFTVELA